MILIFVIQNINLLNLYLKITSEDNLKNKDTKAELSFREKLAKYFEDLETHASDLPGTPDIVLRKYAVCVFVNGCYWHGHQCSKTYRDGKYKWPASALETKRRDKKVISQLETLGFQSFIVWECSSPSQMDKIASAIRTYCQKNA